MQSLLDGRGKTMAAAIHADTLSVTTKPNQKEFPRAKPEGTPEGVYLTVYPEPSPNTDIISF